jgi:hypothetical protein
MSQPHWSQTWASGELAAPHSGQATSAASSASSSSSSSSTTITVVSSSAVCTCRLAPQESHVLALALTFLPQAMHVPRLAAASSPLSAEAASFLPQAMHVLAAAAFTLPQAMHVFFCAAASSAVFLVTTSSAWAAPEVVVSCSVADIRSLPCSFEVSGESARQ